MYDYYLGGAQNFAVDRVAAERALAAVPARLFAVANRAFLQRAVGRLAGEGVAQFLDLGSGLPTVGNVHEVARQVNPAARVAYVDHDPVAVAHADRMLDGQPGVSISQGDARDPDAVLAAPGVAGLLDFTRPVAVLAFAVLHFVAEADDPAGVLAAYRGACVPGSALALSHLSTVTVTGDQQGAAEGVYRNTSTPVAVRSREAITALFTGYRLLDPGVVLLDQWHPDRTVTDEDAAATNTYAGVGILPRTP